jgi:VanZ family protein
VWLPPVIACLAIAVESTAMMSSEHTSGWLRPLFEAVFGRFRNDRWEVLHHLIRKSGHFVGYGTVCLTFLRAWLLTLGLRAEMSTGAWRWRASWRAVVSTALVASWDEWHQTFLPGRTGLASDVLLDTCGATAMCGVVWMVVCWRGRKTLSDAC